MRLRHSALVALVALAVALAVVPASAEPIDTTSTEGFRIQTVPRFPSSSLGTARLINDHDMVVLNHGSNRFNRIWPGIGYPFSDIGCQFCASNPDFNLADVNSSNLFAGSWTSGSGVKVPFVWSQTDGYNQLGRPIGSSGIIGATVEGIDEAGNIAGTFHANPGVCGPSSGTCGFFGSPNSSGGYDYLTVPGGGLALGVGGGVVVGNGFTWSPGSEPVDLPVAPGFAVSQGRDINESGQIAGFVGDGEGTIVAAYWSGPTSSPIVIGTLPGDTHSFASAINELGQVVGWSGTSSDPDVDRSAFFWDPGDQVMVDLGTLPGGTTATAWDINNEGLVAGEANGLPVIWDLFDNDYDIDYPPEITGNIFVAGSEGDLLQIQLSVTDFDGDPFTVTLTGEPSGALWDDVAQTITWQTTTGDAGTHQFLVTATQDDEPANTLTISAQFRVSAPLILDPIGNQEVTEGELLSFTATSSATSPFYTAFGGTPSAQTPLPTGAQIDPFTGTFMWTPDVNQIGDHEITVQVIEFGDPTQPTAHETLTITVQQAGSSEPVTIVVGESILVIDDSTVVPSAVIQIIESIQVTDDVAVRPPVSISIVEAIAVSDDPTVSSPVLVHVAETIDVSDAVVVAPEALASISGTKWEDLDGNASRNAGEPGIQGVVIYLDLNDDGTLDPGEPWTTTSGDGSYGFTDLVPGEWVVREVVPASYNQTFPDANAGFEHRVSLGAREDVTGLDFGNQPDVDLPPMIEPIEDVFGLVGQEMVVEPHVTDPEGDQITLSWEGAPPNAVINGIFVLTPEDGQGDSVFEITLTATQDDNPANTVTETFRVFVAALPAVQGDQPELSPAVIPPGGEVQVSGSGFMPGSSVGIYLFSEPQLLDTTTVGDDGTFTIPVTLPPDVEPGLHHIVVVGVDSDGNLLTLVGELGITSDADGDGLTDEEETDLTGTDHDNPDSDGDGVIDGIDASWLDDYVAGLPNSAFRGSWLGKLLLRMRIALADGAVQLGKSDTALTIIGLIERRVDGCGPRPDLNDWIRDCDAQIEFRELLALYERGVASLPMPNPLDED